MKIGLCQACFFRRVLTVAGGRIMVQRANGVVDGVSSMEDDLRSYVSESHCALRKVILSLAR
jgi:hypothetical protein